MCGERSYTVRTNEGQVLQTNHAHLRKRAQPSPSEVFTEDESSFSEDLCNDSIVCNTDHGGCEKQSYQNPKVAVIPSRQMVLKVDKWTPSTGRTPFFSFASSERSPLFLLAVASPGRPHFHQH